MIIYIYRYYGKKIINKKMDNFLRFCNTCNVIALLYELTPGLRVWSSVWSSVPLNRWESRFYGAGERIYMGNVRRVHTQISVLARRSPNALHASSCKTDWLRGWCHRRPLYTLALFLFPFATINITVCVRDVCETTHTSASVPRLMMHRDDTVSRRLVTRLRIHFATP